MVLNATALHKTVHVNTMAAFRDDIKTNNREELKETGDQRRQRTGKDGRSLSETYTSVKEKLDPALSLGKCRLKCMIFLEHLSV